MERGFVDPLLDGRLWRLRGLYRRGLEIPGSVVYFSRLGAASLGGAGSFGSIRPSCGSVMAEYTMTQEALRIEVSVSVPVVEVVARKRQLL